jgi:hypothetical protein
MLVLDYLGGGVPVDSSEPTGFSGSGSAGFSCSGGASGGGGATPFGRVARRAR